MPKWSVRDLVAKRTEKKTLNPQVRNMLLSLDGVYEARPRSAESARSDSGEVGSTDAPADDHPEAD